MKFETFELERNQSLYENKVDYNLSESGIHPLKMSEILTTKEQKEILGLELSYGHTNGTVLLRKRVSDIYQSGLSEKNVLILKDIEDVHFGFWKTK